MAHTNTHTHTHANITLIIINDNVRSHTSTTNACNAYLEFGMGKLKKCGQHKIPQTLTNS